MLVVTFWSDQIETKWPPGRNLQILLTQHFDDIRSIKGKVMNMSSPSFLYGYVVKTYPSIDLHSTPPPPVLLNTYKCQIYSIACCDVITSQHALHILSGGNWLELVRQQHVYNQSVWKVSAESTCIKRYSHKRLVMCLWNERLRELYHNWSR